MRSRPAAFSRPHPRYRRGSAVVQLDRDAAVFKSSTYQPRACPDCSSVPPLAASAPSRRARIFDAELVSFTPKSNRIESGRKCAEGERSEAAGGVREGAEQEQEVRQDRQSSSLLSRLGVTVGHGGRCASDSYLVPVT
ncbi:hypothetical protein MSAN_00907000 [Mycena sanguinolenta]|uniref:Uncharacterized protein n=1 Tax=Mycena sanguinolenta TaxID=230812 RepID=A0A8H6YSQ4_9AGAR|nr:hypothetical protein MSAN_00907000 [Mycena sanguinolenta]